MKIIDGGNTRFNKNRSCIEITVSYADYELSLV